MAKDVRLYLGAVEAEGGPAVLGEITASVWDRFAAAEPGADFTRIYPFVEGTGGRAGERGVSGPARSGTPGRPCRPSSPR